MPFVEEGNVYNPFDKKSTTTGWVGVNLQNKALLKEVEFSYMRCPSTSLPWMARPDVVNVMRPCYTGVSGAVDDSTAKDMISGSPQYGKLSFGGVLINHRPIELREVVDGTSNTLMTAEQSQWCRDLQGNEVDCRADNDHGFTMGPFISDQYNRMFNLTAVMHRVNDLFADNIGVPRDGPNTPIQSAHPGGAHVGMVDGSVRFLSEGIELQPLYYLANRDDGQVTSIP
jgi:prepilin-type processing-associated H-X9-DG protein